MMTLPNIGMKDRVNIFVRGTDVVSQSVVHPAFEIKYRNVRCLITTTSSSAFLSLFGNISDTELIGVFGKFPRLQEGYQLQVVGTEIRYNVKSIEFYPNPHRIVLQRCSLTVDLIPENL